MTKRPNILLKSWRNLGRWDKIRLGLILIIFASISLSFLVVKLRIGYKKSASERTPNVGFAVWMQCLKESSDKRGDEYLAAIDGCLTLGGMRSPTVTPIPTVSISSTPGPTSPIDIPTPTVTLGQNITGELTLFESFSFSQGSKLPNIVVDNAGKRHIVWWDKKDKRIHYTTCATTKASCSADETLSQAGEAFYPSIALDTNGVPHVVWEVKKDGSGYDIFYSRLNGGSWSEPKQISHEPYSEMASIRVDTQGTIHVVYQSKGTKGVIYYISSADSGTTWSSPFLVGDGLYPRITLANGTTPYVVWNGNSSDSYGIFYRYKNSGWSNSVLVARGKKEQISDIRVDQSGTVHLVWGNYLISKVEYASFKNDKEVENRVDIVKGVTSLWPKFELDSAGNVYVVYQGHTVPGEWDIYYVVKTSGGWKEPVKMTNAGGVFQTPGIGLNGKDGAIVYYSKTNMEVVPFDLK